MRLIACLLLACGGPVVDDCPPVACDASTYQPACVTHMARGGECVNGRGYVVNCSTGERAALCATSTGDASGTPTR